MARAGDKYLSYFWILEELQRAQGCALCNLEEAGLRRQLDGLLQESVNDPGIRAQLVRSRGYCREHARVLLGAGDGLGIAMLYSDQVKLFAEFLDRTKQARLLRRRDALASWALHAACPACQAQSADRARYVNVFLEGLGEEELRKAFESGPGLCVPHCLAALDSANDAQRRRWLLETQRAKAEGLLRELEEFCRKHDYRFASEGFGPEADAWRRAVAFMVGGGGR